MDTKDKITKVKNYSFACCISFIYLGLVGCGAIVITRTHPSVNGPVHSIGGYARSIGTTVDRIGVLSCHKWIKLDHKYLPQCIQLLTTLNTPKNCLLSPHCGHTIYYNIRSSFWTTVGLCYGVGEEPVIVKLHSNTLFSDGWFPLCQFVPRSPHNRFKFVFTDYIVKISSDYYIAFSEYFLESFVVHDSINYIKQIPTNSTDGKFCFKNLVDYNQIILGPDKLENIYNSTYLMTEYVGIHPFVGDRIYDYHVKLITTESKVYFNYYVKLVDYYCQTYIQTTPVNSVISLVGNSIYILITSLLYYLYFILYHILQPLFLFINIYIFVTVLLFSLYHHYSFTSSTIYASIVAFVAETLITCLDNDLDVVSSQVRQN